MYSYSGAYLWNSLPEDVRTANSLDDFKRKIHLVCWSLSTAFTRQIYVKQTVDLFNQVSDLHLQWQLNQSIDQSEVGLKQLEYKTPKT